MLAELASAPACQMLIILNQHELGTFSTCKDSLLVRGEGTRQVTCEVTHESLDKPDTRSTIKDSLIVRRRVPRQVSHKVNRQPTNGRKHYGIATMGSV